MDRICYFGKLRFGEQRSYLIFKFEQTGIAEDGKAKGRFISTGVRPQFMDRLEAAGVRLPASTFRERIMMEC